MIRLKVFSWSTVDGAGEEGSEIPLALEPDDMTGKHRDGEKIPLERAPFSGVEGTGLKGSEELHLKMQQTAVVDFLQADCISTDQGEITLFK